MKNFAKIFTAIVVAFAAYSCIADATEDLGVQVGNGEGQTTIALSFGELTKVQLGEKAGEVYPLYWSEGDAIAVNGVASNELTGVGENATEAQFIVEGVSYPLNIVYPAPTVTEADVAEEGEAVAVYPVVFPAVQQYVPGNVDPKAVVLYGYTAEEPTAPVQLSHLTGVLQLNVKGAVTLTSLTVNARSGNIAGTYNVNCETGALTEVEASNTVTMTFGEGLALNADTATPIYVAVPAGSHGAVWVTLHTATDKMTVKFDSANKPVSAGNVREFKAFEYEANTADEDSEVFEINSVDKLIEFATSKAANFFPLTRAVVTADINMTGVEWTPIEGFGAFEFDGGEHTITGLTAPLFGTTNADIHHLTLADVALNITDNGNSGAFARRIIGGSLRYCSATGTSTIDCAEYNFDGYKNGYCAYAHGGLVGHIVGTTVDNCTNEIDVTVVNICAPVVDRSFKAAIGGIAGCYSNTVSLTNLVNKGDVLYSGTTQAGTLYLSGIVGRSTEHPENYGYVDHVAALANCTNYGLISNAAGSVSTSGILLSGIIGAIVTTGETEITATNLINEAADGNGVVAKGASVNVNVAGIVANSCQAHLNGCENRTTVGIGSGATVEYADVAGILVGVGRNGRVIENCHNNGGITITPNITIKTPEVDDTKEIDGVALAAGVKIYNVNVGGIVANTTMNCTIRNCSNTKTIKTKGDISGANLVLSKTETANGKAQTHTGGLTMGGICGYVDDSTTIENCTNSGKIYQEKDVADANPTYIRLGGIVGMNKDAKKCTINNCTNNGVVAYTAKKTGLVDLGVAGIIGYASHGATINSCTNNVEVGGAGYAMKLMGFGGIVGTSSRGSVKVIGCENYGTITQSQGTYKKTGKAYGVGYGLGLGGIVGFAQSIQEISGCENYGQITIKNTNTGSDNDVFIYVGGIMGAYVHRDASDASGSRNKSIKNCTNCVDLTFTGNAGRYFAGGVIGYLASYENANHYWEEISGLKNIANLDFSGVGTATGKNSAKYPPYAGYGGIVGFAEFHEGGTYEKEFVPLNDCTFYGNMIIGTESNGVITNNSRVQANCGVLLGSERVATEHIFKNAKIGGYINATMTTEIVGGTPGYFDPDENWVEGTPGEEVTTYTGGTALSAENIHTYLYKGGIEADVATTDGYTILTERPAAPAVQ